MCPCVCGNDVVVKPDPQSPLPPDYWVVCFAECLLEVGIIETSPDGQRGTSEDASQYIFNWSVSVCGLFQEAQVDRKKKRCSVCGFVIKKLMWKPNILDKLNLWPSLIFSHSSLLWSSLPETLLKLPHLETISSPKQTDQLVRSEIVCPACLCASPNVCFSLSHRESKTLPLTSPHKMLPKSSWPMTFGSEDDRKQRSRGRGEAELPWQSSLVEVTENCFVLSLEQ